MPRSRVSRKCAVEGCGCWALRTHKYCAQHFRQWQENVTLGLSDPEPRLVGDLRERYKGRSCKSAAVKGGSYCSVHTQQFQENAAAAVDIAQAFSALLTRLDATPEDCPSQIQREVDLLAEMRKILVAHAEMASRTGWKGISVTSFVRLWLSSVSTANDLAKTRFVMENASAGDFDRLLSGVYRRIDGEARLPSAAARQELLPGIDETAARGAGTIDAQACGFPPAAVDPPTAEEQLADWLNKANVTLGCAVLSQVLNAYARESNLDHDLAVSLVTLADGLPEQPAQAQVTPEEMGRWVSALAEIVAQGPDITAVRQRLITVLS